MSIKLPRGFKCQGCGRKERFPAYVYAHWDIGLLWTCPDCETTHRVQRGHVMYLVLGKKIKQRWLAKQNKWRKTSSPLFFTGGR